MTDSAFPKHSDVFWGFRYIELYMDVVANSQNVSLLYHLASRLKTVQDLRDSGDVNIPPN